MALAPGLPRRPGWTPLTAGGGEGTSLGWLPLGAGDVLVIADGEELANRSLEESVIAITVTRAVVDLLEGDTLVFSEYHQGLAGGGGLVRASVALAAGLPVGRIFLHLAATGALLLLLVGRRFGGPLPPAPTPRRSTVEHVDAVAHIYRAGRSYRAVARHLIRSAARRMRLPAGADSPEALLRRWAARPDLAGPASAALTTLDAEPPDLHTLEAVLDDAVRRHTSLRTPQ